MGGDEILERLLATVRRRTLVQLLLEQGSLAIAAGCVILLLLLLAGTQVLEWYWPPLVVLATLAYGVWRIRGRIPTSYETAQAIDAQLQLKDALSTAVFFANSHNAERAPRELIQAQRRFAESLAASADPVVASPLRFPRQAWPALGAFVLCGALLVTRYGFRGSLDLTQPLVHIPFETLFGSPDQVAKKEAPKQQALKEFEGLTVPAEAGQEQPGDKKATADDQAMQSDLSDGQPSPDGNTKQAGAGKDQEGKEGAEGNEKAEGASAGDEKGQKEGNSPQQGSQNAKSASQPNSQQNSSQQAGENSSLMDKMKDAMANMMARMKMSQQAGQSKQSQQAGQQGSPQQASNQNKQGQKGSPSPGQAKSEGQQSDEAGEQQGEGSSKNMNAQGKMSDAAGEKQSPQEGKSGAGKQDGEKDIKAAEQQAAMGKISELLGKRAQNLTGEVMVEVSSGKQQLKTSYISKSAAHNEAGGEVNRDEIPAAYQEFVQQYFEQVRKAARSAPKGKVSN